jgi:hypothetical protein
VPIVNANHIDAYTRCPRFTKNEWESICTKRLSPAAAAIRQLVQFVYTTHYQTQKPVPWSAITEQLNNFMIEQMITDPSREDYLQAVSFLDKLSIWYHQYYLAKECIPGLINMPTYMNLGHQVIIKESIDVVLITDKIKLIDFADIDRLDHANGSLLYNDWVMQVKAWAFWRATETKPTHYARIYIGEQSVKEVIIQLNDEMFRRTEQVIRYLLTGIKDQIFYPSFSRQCTKCKYCVDCAI